MFIGRTFRLFLPLIRVIVWHVWLLWPHLSGRRHLHGIFWSAVALCAHGEVPAVTIYWKEGGQQKGSKRARDLDGGSRMSEKSDWNVGVNWWLCLEVLPHTCEEISFLNFLTLLLNCKCCVLIFIFGDCLSIYMCIIWRIFMLALLILFNIDFFFSFTFMAFLNLYLFKKKEMLFELK